jgi:hypothetical protein
MQDAKPPFWREVWIQVTAGLIVAGVLAIVATWRWQEIKAYLESVSALVARAACYLGGTAQVRRWVLLAVLAVCVVLPAMIARLVSWWHARRRAEELALVVPYDFSPSVLQRAVIVLMLEKYPYSIRLDEAAFSMSGRIPGQHMSRAQAEQVLEELCHASLIAPLRNGQYRMTRAGRDWVLAHLDSG